MSIKQFFEYYKTIFYNISIILCSLIFLRIGVQIFVSLLRLILKFLQERNTRKNLSEQTISLILDEEIINQEIDSNHGNDSTQINANNNNNTFTRELKSMNLKNTKCNVNYEELMNQLENY
jgi:hypothetical protein